MRHGVRVLFPAIIAMMPWAPPAGAVHVDSAGRGQVLIYPYYTVNRQQQTLVSVTNTSSVAQSAKVLIREGYNGREVLNFDIFLSPRDSWNGTIFALDDAGLGSVGAAILGSDTSCTLPSFASDGTSINGSPYVAFRDYGYRIPDDGGPYTIDRTREGWIEIIARADLAAPWSGYIAHGYTMPPTGCAQMATTLVGAAGISVPSGGLVGTVGIIDVGKGTYLSSRAEALSGFTSVPLYANTGEEPSLASVNDGATPGLLAQATAQISDAGGKRHRLTYPGADPRSRKIDAVSAVLMADTVHNEYQNASPLAAASDWVLTMPTKAFYVDRAHIGSGDAVAPFEAVYDGASATRRFSPARFTRLFYNPDGAESGGGGSFCNFPVPPPRFPDASLRLSTNVLHIGNSVGQAASTSAVLGSKLVGDVSWQCGQTGSGSGNSGWMRVNLDPPDRPHALLPSAEGGVLRGLPMVGFWAYNMVNNNVSDGVLANYAATVRHVRSVTCQWQDGSPCRPPGTATHQGASP